MCIPSIDKCLFKKHLRIGPLCNGSHNATNSYMAIYETEYSYYNVVNKAARNVPESDINYHAGNQFYDQDNKSYDVV